LEANAGARDESKKFMMKNKTANMSRFFNVQWLILGVAIAVILPSREARAAQAPVSLGSAATFGVLAGTTVTAIPTTTVNGDLGVSPGNMVSGGPIVTPPFALHLADTNANQAQFDLTKAYNEAAGRSVAAISLIGELGGLTLAPGLYASTSGMMISSGDLTLDGGGDTNAVWIFQMASTLVTATGRQLILSGGAQAQNIFWQVGSSATLGVNSVFAGTIMAYTAIAMDTGATLNGRALAQHGAVTLASNTITVPNIVSNTVVLVSASVVTDPYTYASGQSVNLATKTITVPKATSIQFYRIVSATALTFTSIAISGGNVVVTYQ
jgi:hypothetical protein